MNVTMRAHRSDSGVSVGTLCVCVSVCLSWRRLHADTHTHTRGGRCAERERERDAERDLTDQSLQNDGGALSRSERCSPVTHTHAMWRRMSNTLSLDRRTASPRLQLQRHREGESWRDTRTTLSATVRDASTALSPLSLQVR